MYKTCPKCGHVRSHADTSSTEVCPACGLIFKKYLKHQFRTATANTQQTSKTNTSQLKTLLLPQRAVDPWVFYGYTVIYLLFFIWGWQFILMDYAYYQIDTRIDDPMPAIGQSFMHNINLIFHEAGHVLFRPFGYFMTILGGSLFQVLVPLIVTGVFLLKERQAFSASIGLWWTGQSLMDIAPYINDARNGQLILLGGTTGAESTGYHDWQTLLGILDWMQFDHKIADSVDALGVLLMLLAFIWGAIILRHHKAHL